MFRSYRFSRWLVISGAIVFASCTQQPKYSAQPIDPILMGLDSMVRPQDDFVQFALGNQTRISIWQILEDGNNGKIASILRDFAENPSYSPGSDQRKAARLFFAGMDSIRLEAEDNKPILREWKDIDAINSLNNLQSWIINHTIQGQNDLLHINQRGEVQFPDFILNPKDYNRYDPALLQRKKAYTENIAQVFALMNGDLNKSKQFAERIVSIESEFARERIQAIAKKIPIAEVVRACPSIPWSRLNLQIDTLTISYDHLKLIDRLSTAYRLPDLKLYLQWCLLKKSAPYLSNRFVQAFLPFENNERQSRQRRVMKEVDVHFRDAIGSVYSRKYVNEDKIEMVKQLVDNIRFSVVDLIKDHNNLVDSVKQYRLNELKNIQIHIGYPTEWRRYSEIAISNDTTLSYFAMQQEISSQELQLDKKGTNVSKSMWPIPVHSERPAWDSLNNVLFIPGGLLQEPVFSNDLAVIYGTVGSLIAEQLILNWKSLSERRQKLGLYLAYQAFQRHKRESPDNQLDKSNKSNQRLFLAWTAIQPRNQKELANQLLKGLFEFQVAFSVQSTDKMFLNEKEVIRIW